jgi:hypothetical protein
MGVHLISFKIEGADGKTKSCVFPVPSTHTETNINDFVARIDQLLDDCIDGFITAVTVNRAVSHSVTGSSAAADRQVDDGGLLSFAVTGSPYSTGIYVPTYALSLIDDNKSIANSGASATLIAALLAGTDCDVSDKYGNVLASFSSGRRAHRK